MDNKRQEVFWDTVYIAPRCRSAYCERLSYVQAYMVAAKALENNNIICQLQLQKKSQKQAHYNKQNRVKILNLFQQAFHHNVIRGIVFFAVLMLKLFDRNLEFVSKSIYILFIIVHNLRLIVKRTAVSSSYFNFKIYFLYFLIISI